jgi:hypothetical protein
MQSMKSRGFIALATMPLLLCGALPAYAGMPSFTLVDVANARFEAISFFIALLLLVALIVQRLWNSLGKDFQKLPRIGYGRALAGVTLWGLLFLLILTMISGARELMTPGAWEKHGSTYRLKDERP